MKWMRLPERTPRNLLKIVGIDAGILYVVLLVSHAIARSPFEVRTFTSLAVLAILTALAAGIGFWLGGRLFYPLYSAGLALGLLYMLYIVVFNRSPGWGDLTSIVGFLFLTVIGLIVGLAAEFIRYLVRSRPKVEH